MGERAAFPQDPEEFERDARISFAREKQTFILEDESGQEWEWRDAVGRWAQAWTQDEQAQHAEVYGQADTEEATASINLPQKRKQAAEEHRAAKAAKRETQPKPEGRAIFVTNLPKTATLEQIDGVFRKFGMIAESISDDEKRIKLYYDDDGDFKGEALIVYHRPESVSNACNLADGAELDPVRPSPDGPMRVTVAEDNYKRHTGNDEAALPKPAQRNVAANKDKKKAKKKAEEMDRRLAEWSDGDDDGEDLDGDEEAPAQKGRGRVLMVTNAFRPRELEEDPEFREDLEADMREEAETHGGVAKVIIYDEDGAGAVAIHFKKPAAAASCAKVFNGRQYNGRQLVAFISTGKENYKKSDA